MKFFLKIIFLLSAIIVFSYLIFSFTDILLAPSSGNNLTPRVCHKNYCFNVELSRSIEDKINGLMFRKSLAENEGMLFIFDSDEKYSFWMKNTLLPLDIIWIDRDKKVVFIKENAQPCADEYCPTINPDAYARYVLEIKAGISEKIGLKVGDEVYYSGY